MTVYISVRNVTITDTLHGVQIIVETDVPAHLFLRMSTNPPWIHKKPVLRRGMWLNDDVRFCFTVFEDNEQAEAGDTLVHTFIKEPWPICETRYFYIWGATGGNVSVSTSAIFEFHHTQYIKTEGFFAYDPDKCVVLASGAWVKVTHLLGGPLKDLLPPNATVAFLQVVNRGAPQNIGLRPVDSTHNQLEWQNEAAHQWTHVALDDDNNFEIYLQNRFNFDIWLMGYATSAAVVTFLDPLNRSPEAGNAWLEIDLSSECPNAVGILCEVLQESTGQPFGLRKHGSVDDRKSAMHHDWPIIGCDTGQKINFYPSQVGANIGKLFITGYIKDLAAFHTNAPDKSLAITTSYQTISLTSGPTLAFLEIYAPLVIADMALRAVSSAQDLLYQPNWRHTWAIVPLDSEGKIEGKIENLNTDFFHIGSGS